MILKIYKDLEEVVLYKFGDIVLRTEIILSPSGLPRKLRMHLINET